MRRLSSHQRTSQHSGCTCAKSGAKCGCWRRRVMDHMQRSIPPPAEGVRSRAPTILQMFERVRYFLFRSPGFCCVRTASLAGRLAAFALEFGGAGVAFLFSGGAARPAVRFEQEVADLVCGVADGLSGDLQVFPRAGNRVAGRQNHHGQSGGCQKFEARHCSISFRRANSSNNLVEIRRLPIFGQSLPPISRSLRMPPHILPIVLLSVSNLFMTFAWYGHLKFKAAPLLL